MDNSMEDETTRKQIDKQEAEKCKTKGNEYFKAKKYIEAIDQYSQAIVFNGEEPSYFGNRAACYLAQLKYDLCIKDCDQALKLDPNFSKALRRKALCYKARGQFEKSIENFESSLKIEKDKTVESELKETHQDFENYKKLKEKVNNNQWDQAIVLVNSLILRVISCQDLQMKQVEVKAKLGNTDEAMSLLNNYYAKWEDAQSEIYYLKGIIQLYQGDSEKAKKSFVEGMKFDPDNKKCRIALNISKDCERLKEQGNNAIKEQKYKDCIQYYEQAINLDPQNRKFNAICYSNKGLAHQKMKELKQALVDYNKSIELDNKYVKSYLRKAEVLQDQGEFEEALRVYNAAQEIDKNQNLTKLIEDCKRKLKQSKKKDYYAILGVPRTADEKEIKKAYRKLAVQWHPDKHKEDETKDEATKKFKDISEAYAVLSDPKKKQMFDQGIDPNDQESGGQGFGGDIDPSQIFQMFFGGGGGGFGPNVRFSTSGGHRGGGGGGFPFGGFDDF